MSRPWMLLPAAFLLTGPLGATEVQVFRSNSQKAFLSGELDAISVDPLGTLRLADRAERVTRVEEPFLFDVRPRGDGWVAATGNSGRVLQISADGSSEILFEVDEPEIFALWVDDDLSVLAGSSPDGKVYRHRDGETSVFFDPEETYIWQLARDSRGHLLVATGTEGKLYRVDPEGRGEVLFDSDDTHLRTLRVLEDDSALVGTAGDGLLLHIDRDGSARTVHDAAAPEIVALTPDGGEGAYLAVLASEASFVDLTRPSSSEDDKDDEKEEPENGTKVVASESSDTASAGSRVRGFRGPRSEVLHWTPTGGVQPVWKFEDETVFSLLVHGDRLWVATGLQGQLYSFQNEQMVLEKDVEESQIVALVDGAEGPVFATTNASALYRFVEGKERSGTLTSDVLDARRLSDFGTLHWRGDSPKGTSIRFSLRSGMSAEPDKTWGDWSPELEGDEIQLADIDQSRYLQWRLHLASRNGRSPELRAVEISYLQINQRPEINSLSVLDAGQVLVPSNFNPNSQAFEPAHPNRDGIFTTVGDPPRRDERNLKTLWKRGYRTLRWSASDPNSDELRYTVSFRREDDPEGWLPMEEELERNRYSFDATVLPDGNYRFRVLASDEPGNPEGRALTATKASDVIAIDHGDPTLSRVESRDGKLIAEVGDRLSPLREAVYSINATAWEPAVAEDGLLDARGESVVIPIGDDARIVLLRLTDAAFNVVTWDLTPYLP